MSNANLSQTTGLQGWLDKLENEIFPVFPETCNSLQQLSEEDANRSVDRFCSDILFDPGGVIAILRKANSGRRGGLGTYVSTVENAAMMIGVNAMRALTKEYPTIEPPGNSAAEKGYMRIVARAYHVAYQAYDWAVQRGDMTPKEIFVAAFLRDIGAMTLWLYAGEQMQAIHELKWEKQVPDDEAQYVVLGFSQEQLGQRLAELWSLPEMVSECLQAEDAHNPRALTVKLANQMVHLSETGWYTDEMVECLESVAKLLDISYDDVVKRVHKNAIEVARETALYDVSPSATLLPMTSAEWPTVHGQKRDEQDGKHFCLMPQKFMYDAAKDSLTTFLSEPAAISDIVEIAMAGLHDGLGLNRVVFALLSKDLGRLEGRFINGADSDPAFSQFAVDVDLSSKDLFSQLLQKPRSVWVSTENHDRIWPLVPEKFKDLINTQEFYTMSVFAQGKPLGVFYADRHLEDSHLDQKSYDGFKALCSMVSKAIEFGRK
jgi:HD-like signal output (HDOD) protein